MKQVWLCALAGAWLAGCGPSGKSNQAQDASSDVCSEYERVFQARHDDPPFSSLKEAVTVSGSFDCNRGPFLLPIGPDRAEVRADVFYCDLHDNRSGSRVQAEESWADVQDVVASCFGEWEVSAEAENRPDGGVERRLLLSRSGFERIVYPEGQIEPVSFLWVDSEESQLVRFMVVVGP